MAKSPPSSRKAMSRLPPCCSSTSLPPDRRRATSPASTAVFSSSWRLQNRCFEPGRSEITTSTAVSPIRSGRRATLISASWPARQGSKAKAAPIASAIAGVPRSNRNPAESSHDRAYYHGGRGGGSATEYAPESNHPDTTRARGHRRGERLDPDADRRLPGGRLYAYDQRLPGLCLRRRVVRAVLLRAAQPMDHQGPSLGALRRQGPGRARRTAATTTASGDRGEASPARSGST